MAQSKFVNFLEQAWLTVLQLVKVLMH
jgi:hypothetical protein